MYYVAATIFAVPFDAQGLKVLGGPVPVIESVSQRNFDLSDNGTAAYVSADSALLGHLLWVDREGNEQALTTEPGNYDLVALSPDRSMVAYNDFGSASESIWTYDVETGVHSQETFDGAARLPVWSPNGNRLAFTSAGNGGDFDIYAKMIDPRGEPELLLQREGSQFPDSWSPDGRTLAFHEYKRGNSGPQDIYTLSLDDMTVTPFLTTEANERGPMFSSDGKWIAYVSDEQGDAEVYVMPFPAEQGGKVRISYGGGSEPRWSVDGT